MLAGLVLSPLFRLLSGMHWLTDIIGGCLYSIMFIMLYKTLLKEPKGASYGRWGCNS
ncbi:MAG: phosphatase PAP2 family protein [Solobacterium sp.]|nr:phosphatase PAP2 family protein [Solobacterium sp.]